MQLHIIVHLVDGIALCDIVHAWWMFFLERFMKTLKGFVRQNVRPAGSMAEGWLIQESLVHIYEFLIQVDRSLSRMWRDEVDIRMASIVPQGKGWSKVMDNEMINNLNHFCWLNSDVMKKWMERYEHAKASGQRQRARFRTQHGPRVPYSHHLRTLLKDMDVNWLHEEMERVERDKGMCITSLEWSMVKDAY